MPAPLQQAVATMARKQDRTFSEVVRQAVRKELAINPKNSETKTVTV